MSKYVREYFGTLYVISMIFIMLSNVLFIPGVADEDLKPDLIIESITCPDNITEGDILIVTVEIKNIGNKNTSAEEIIDVGLFIDNVFDPVSTNSTDKSLSISESFFMNLYWTATLGATTNRRLFLEVDYQNNISEIDDNNNIIHRFPGINVYERDTDLEIKNIIIHGSPRVNQTVHVYANVTNNGKDTGKIIYARLKTSKEGEIGTKLKMNGLSKYENYTFMFEWTPTLFGNQAIRVEVYFTEGDIEDFMEISEVFVDVSQLEWWDTSWHYRCFVIVKGNGNVAEPFNFTQMLNSLNVPSSIFEDDTIRIIEYHTDGSIVDDGEVNIFRFNESVGYDNETNANGTLIWDVTGSSAEKYYCIYFDVKDNPEGRTSMPETNDINKSGDALVSFRNLEGWWAEVIKPIEGSYSLINGTTNLIVETKAKAENVTAFISWDRNENHSFTRYLANAGDYTLWTNETLTFDREGNWTISIISRDKVGYKPDIVEHFLYVGLPDLEVVDISIKTYWPYPSSMIYKDDKLNITAYIVSYHVTVENVNIKLSIYNKDNDLFVYNYTITDFTMFEGEDNLVSFNWTANQTGYYIINITITPIENELNEDNNYLTKDITVHGWPDLAVEAVIIPTESVTEGDSVTIKAVIANYGEGDANDYKIGLYIEDYQQGNESGIMFMNLVSNISVNVKVNTTLQINLSWEPAEIGVWAVGVKVILTDGKRDSFSRNNELFSKELLTVKSHEKNKPVISDVRVEPDPQEQGEPVSIIAKITDDSGLRSVTITITSPTGEIYDKDVNMIQFTLDGNWFRYYFKDTNDYGTYTFVIKAADISIYANNATKEETFFIKKDTTDPIIYFFDVDPHVQLKNKNVNITCIVSDNIEIKKVTVTIDPPDDPIYNRNMDLSSSGEYVYKDIYEIYGRYSCYITVQDIAGNTINTSDSKEIFWITSDLDDRDNDGMSDWWEEKYGLDPEDPSDADKDADGDGYTNLKEHEIGTNPIKDIFMENAAYRIKENIWYLASSIVLFLLILFLSVFGIRRKKYELD